MCSLNSEVSQISDTRSDTDLRESCCKKCHDHKADVVLRRKDAYCRSCFLASCTHKFRATLGKSRAVRTGDQVLVAFSGSQSSAALLHLIRAGLDEATHRQLHFSASVIYIDEGSILGSALIERRQRCAAVVREAAQYGFPVYVTGLEMSLCDTEAEVSIYSVTSAECEDVTFPISEKLEDKIIALFGSLKYLTAKEDLLKQLRRKLLCAAARQLRHEKVFSAETGTTLVIHLLTCVALGRGAQLPDETGFLDTREADILMLRPMREFINKEIVFYNTFHNVHFVSLPSLGTKTAAHASISRLTEQFVTGLQVDFPATVSTVFRIGDKLTAGKREKIEEDGRCILCKACVDTAVGQSSSLQATFFSQAVSLLGPAGLDQQLEQFLATSGKFELSTLRQSCNTAGTKLPDSQTSDGWLEPLPGERQCSFCGEGEEGACHSRRKYNQPTKADVMKFLCYGCCLIVRDIDNVLTLPPDVLVAAIQNQRRANMRHEIEEFLIT